MTDSMLQNDSRPLYVRLMEALLADIRQAYKPGDLLPTQQALAERYGASLITVKRALDEIGRMGLVESVRGRGTIVRRPMVVDVHTGVSSWTETMRAMGAEPHTSWNDVTIEDGKDEIRRLLRLKSNEKLVVLRRLRLLDGVPTALISNQIPAHLVPGLAERGLDEESLYAVLRKRYGLSVAYADEEVTALPAKEYEHWAFGDDCDTVLQVTRTSYDANDRPIEFSRLTAPKNRYTYRVRISANTD